MNSSRKTCKSSSGASWLTFAGPFEFPRLNSSDSPTSHPRHIARTSSQSSFSAYENWDALKEYFRPHLPSLPFEDAFLCPPIMDSTFETRKFDTPEQEEAWWNDPTTWPGDHLVAPSEDLSSFSPSASAAAQTERPYSLSPPPEFHNAVYGDTISWRHIHTGMSPKSPSSCNIPTQTSETRMHPDHSALKSNINSTLSTIKLKSGTLEESSVQSSSLAANSEKGRGKAVDIESSQEWVQCSPGGTDDDEASESEDSDWLRTPPHHTRPGPTRRSVVTSSRRNCSSSSPKGRRVYKPRTRISHLIPVDLARRPPVDVSTSMLKAIRSDFSRLQAENRSPTQFVVEHPIKDSPHPHRRWRCAWEENGLRCSVTSERKAEARRHTLTHETLRWLCGNPNCCQLFSREDAVVRHLTQSSCKTKLPPGTTTKTETPAIIMDDGEARLVQLVWLGEPREE